MAAQTPSGCWLLNNKSFNLPASMTSTQLTLTPPSYAGYPTTGHARGVVDNEIMVVQFTSHPWTLIRNLDAPDNSTPATHAQGATFRFQATAGALMELGWPSTPLMAPSPDYPLLDPLGFPIIDPHTGFPIITPQRLDAGQDPTPIIGPDGGYIMAPA